MRLILALLLFLEACTFVYVGGKSNTLDFSEERKMKIKPQPKQPHVQRGFTHK
jgi:hypothetical protein